MPVITTPEPAGQDAMHKAWRTLRPANRPFQTRQHHPMNGSRPLVLFSITMGWGIRNFLHTGLFDAVSRFADIGVAASEDLLPFFTDMQKRGEVALVVELPSRENTLCRMVRQANKAVLQGAFGISTAQIRSQEKARGPASRACRTALWSLQRMLAARWEMRAIESLEVRLASSDLAQLQVRPSVMVSCSPFDSRDKQLQRSLHRKGVPTIAVIPSWDNPSTKGCISTCADLVLVWGSHQKSELESYYPKLSPKRIRISGIPQFDLYYQDLPDEFAREPFLKRLSIAPESKVILYATCAERLFPTEPDVVAQLREATAQNCFGSNVHLLIRCHPADRAARYEHLCCSRRVSIFPSSLKDSDSLYSWTPPEKETATLAATLRHCEVCINTASTMTLDAFACGKPVVNVAYDGEQEPPYLQSVRRYYDFHHYRPIARSGAVSVARSSRELLKFIEESLTNPQQMAARREEVFNTYCFRPAKGSVEFIVREIERLTNESSSRMERNAHLRKTGSSNER